MKKKYILTVHPAAEMDIESSFLWGCRRWGRKKAKAWVRDLRQAVLYLVEKKIVTVLHVRGSYKGLPRNTSSKL